MAEAKLTLTAVDQTRAAFDSVRRNLGDVERTAGSLRSTLAGIGVGLSAGALVGFVRTAIDAADNLGKLSQRVGVTVESLSELQYAGKLADVSTEQLGDGLRKLSVNLQEAAGGSKEFQAAFAAVGISAAELGNLKADAALGGIADAFARADDGAAKTALAVKLFGRAGADLIPLLNQGSAGLRDAADEARRFGLVITSDAARAAETFNDNLTRLSSSAQSLGITLANAVLPAVTEFTNELLDGEKAFGSFGSALASIVTNVNPFKDINQNLRETRENIEKIRAQLESIPAGAYRLRESLGVKLDEQIRVKEFLESRQRAGIKTNDPSTFDARDLAARQGQRRADLRVVVDNTRNKKSASEGLTESERAALAMQMQADREFEQMLDRMARGREQAQQEFLRRFQDGNETDAKVAEEQAAAIDRILAGTRSGQERGVFADLEQLNEALIVGKVSAEQYEEAYGTLQEKLNDIRGVSKDTFGDLSNDGNKALRDLQNAVEGWGRSFSQTIADSVLEGKLEFEDFARAIKSIVRDVLAKVIQRNIAEPLISAGTSALGNIFGAKVGAGAGSSTTNISGFAEGGRPPVGRASWVGEQGPELFVPDRAGTIVPNHALGGSVTIVQYIDSRTDLASIAAISRATERRIIDRMAVRR